MFKFTYSSAEKVRKEEKRGASGEEVVAQNGERGREGEVGMLILLFFFKFYTCETSNLPPHLS